VSCGGGWHGGERRRNELTSKDGGEATVKRSGVVHSGF
jgi:hypothetical protein